MAAVNQLIADYFKLVFQVVDWIMLCQALGGLLMALPIGLLCIAKPLHTKIFFKSALLQYRGFIARSAVVLHTGKGFPLLMISGLLTGVANTVYFVLIPLVGTVWFGEREQGTIYGIGWFAVSAGGLLATVLPTLLLHLSSPDEVAHDIHRVVYVFVFICVFSFSSLLGLCVLIPNMPAIPPSRVEAMRVQAISSSIHELTMKKAIRDFIIELKVLITEVNNMILSLIFAIAQALFSVQYMMTPIISTDGDESIATLASMKLRILISFSVGGLVAAVATGIAVDKFKQYNPMARFIGVALFLSSILMILCFYFKLQIVMYFAYFFYGAFIGSITAFVAEILKQTVHLKVSESTQGIWLAIGMSVFTFIIPPVVRLVYSKYGPLYFFILNSSLALIPCIMACSINPKLQRFLTETVRLMDGAADIERNSPDGREQS
uniref:uncharacterized MFS-type transporter C09D4.1-like n=1 Tax=Styela clava TaxID=7725 RepID=UPI00193A4B9E|nr:uncharacterized MFS-type transporter C09D4.1-like [Styela clava]